MKPFLYSIAEAYATAEPEAVVDYCFVFPNKRSGVFFHHAFARACKEHGVKVPHPATTTISDFVEDLTGGILADRLELIFILYQAYREVIFRRGGADRNAQDFAENAVDFNKFQRWADMLLGDFNDVDMYLVDPAEIFPNLERYREISANYVEPEVIEEIKRHWKVERLPEFGDAFWNHILHQAQKEREDGDENPKGEEEPGSALQFFRLWQVMLDVYTTFRRLLEEKGMHYSGMAYRQAVDIIRSTRRDDFEFKRYIFVGFNMLTTAEKKIFNLLKAKNTPADRFADFYFDDASPAFRHERNSTARFLESYREMFPSLYDCVEPIEGFPKIEIVGITSRVGQAQVAGGIVGTLYPKDEKIPTEKLRRTAIVLPQETLAQAVLASVPSWISAVNLTMGYKLRDSRTATFVRDIVSMHIRSRKSRSNQQTFFYEDVLRVLTHPLVQQLYAPECREIVYEININRLYNIDVNYLVAIAPALSPIFKYVDHHDSAEEVFGYFERLFDWLNESWERFGQQAEKGNPIGESSTPAVEELQVDSDGKSLEKVRKVKATAIIDRMLTRAYTVAIKRLKALSNEYLAYEKDVTMVDTTLFHLLERLVGGETINFEGRPLEGLQVMGVLEARSLDFENVIIPSMNERIFPRKHYQKSFIPPHLRAAYGMSTPEHQESIYSYYFYRMISRAKRVFLLYDTRTQGTGGGQMSRYLAQLMHIYPSGVDKPIPLSYPLVSQKDALPFIEKTPEIMAELERYRSRENPRNLSASSINQYINCPLSFYLSYIAGFKRENEYHDYMDESTYGTIVHGVLEDLYKNELKNHPGQLFTRQVLEALKGRKVEIQQTITKRINNHYNRLGENCLTPLRGDAEIFGQLIQKYVEYVIDNEIKLGEFEFLHGEYGDPIVLTISDGVDTENINFTFSIDRVDRLHLPQPDGEGRTSLLRVIDYKTGADATTTGKVEDMFNNNVPGGRPKAMLQLMLYCQALEQKDGLNEPIMPMIYPIRKVAKVGFSPLTITGIKENGKSGKVPILDYRDYVIDFNRQMLNVLSDMFNPEIPFEAASDPHACTFCEFHEICRRKKS